MKTVIQRWAAKVALPMCADGCWIWKACTVETRGGNGGYGRMNVGGRAVYAHRFSWEIFRGPIPKGMVIDHTCRVRECVNPEHLRVVTPRVNALENTVNTRSLRGLLPACPVCGAEYTGRPDGRRECRPCRIRRDCVRLARKRVAA